MSKALKSTRWDNLWNSSKTISKYFFELPNTAQTKTIRSWWFLFIAVQNRPAHFIFLKGFPATSQRRYLHISKQEGERYTLGLCCWITSQVLILKVSWSSKSAQIGWKGVKDGIHQYAPLSYHSSEITVPFTNIIIFHSSTSQTTQRPTRRCPYTEG